MTAPARSITRFAATLRYEDIPLAVRERARIQILDGLGVGLASNAYPFADVAIAGLAHWAARGLHRDRAARAAAGTRRGARQRHPDPWPRLRRHAISQHRPRTRPASHALSLWWKRRTSTARDMLAAYAAGMEMAIRSAPR